MIPRNLITMAAMSIKSWKKPKKFLYGLIQKEMLPSLKFFSLALHNAMKHALYAIHVLPVDKQPPCFLRMIFQKGTPIKQQ